MGETVRTKMAQSESLQQLVEGTRDKNRPACEGWCGEKTHDANGEPIWTLVDRTSSVGYAIACSEAPTGQRFTPSISLSPPPSPPSGSEGPSILTCGFKQREAPAGASIRPPSARHVAQYAARHDRHVAQYAARHDQSQALSQTGLRISQRRFFGSATDRPADQSEEILRLCHRQACGSVRGDSSALSHVTDRPD